MDKSYLITLSLISGEYEQTFHRIFKAKNTRMLDKKLHKYFIDYYPEGKKERDDLYFYYGGEIAVKIEGYTEITDPQQVLDKLTTD